jgi:hypothetical protein
MTEDVIEDAFADPEAAKLTIHTPPWRPYSRALMLLPERMPTGESINEKTSTKRGRSEESYINHMSSYANAVTNTPRTDSVTTLKNETTFLTNIHKQMEDLQRNMEEKFTKQMEDNKAETLKIIEETNQV